MLSKENTRAFFYALSIAWQLGFLIAFPIIGFIFLGILGDRYFQSGHVFLVLGVFIGLTVSFYEVYNLLKPLIKKRKNA